MSLLTDIDRALLHRVYNPATFTSVHRDAQSRIIVEVDAKPLEALVEAAALGYRVYELMSINRAGDILHYLELNIVDVRASIQSSVNSIVHRGDESKPDCRLIPYRVFDSIFEKDIYFDSSCETENWLGHRTDPNWRQYLKDLLRMVKVIQQRLRCVDDFLLKHEIKLIDDGNHEFDLLDRVDRRCLSRFDLDELSPLPAYFLALVADLITRDDVRTVSCTQKDHRLWRILIAEQVNRAVKTGLPPKEALGLCGIDGHNQYESLAKQWGGEIHSPYEGICPSDIFIKPFWYRSGPFVLKESKQLTTAHGYCRYYLTQVDHGDLEHTNRTVYNDWFLYESTSAYKPNDWNIPCYEIPAPATELEIDSGDAEE